MLLAEIAKTSEAVAAAPARRTKIDLLARCLREAGPAEVAIAVSYLSGELPQRQIGVGYAALQGAPPPAAEPSLTLAEVDAAFSRIGGLAGKGSVAARRDLLRDLLGRATGPEQAFLIGLLAGELRQGALDGVMADAVAAAAQVPAAEVRRAAMLRGALAPVAVTALTSGVEGLREYRLEVGRPVKPMLAASAASLEEAIDGTTPVAVEWKLDGIRVQAHVSPGDVRLFTRTLDDITDRLPEIVTVLRGLPVRSAVFDGELIALREDGSPQPFQVTSARTASREGAPISVFLFDVLHLDGTDLLDRPEAERWAAQAGAVPADLLIPRLETAALPEATAFFEAAVARGHEGVVVKSLDAPYAAGRRGAGWIKVKPRHTLDLVVLAAEWGHGRRKGWLSNLHLGARDPETGGWVMLGKTFKGLTDEMLRRQTERLLDLALPGESTESWTVRVRPELVVEVAFDGVQRSSRYPGGMALRFARVVRYRPDKSADEADTVETVRAIAGPVLD
ncbi:MAG TPA: ATP-dependent DNA ligase [Streptosporangiaceae bacterium]|nr:ATP-dependent DNA ligase [Streptosporangiaceae bacterium]